MDPTSSALVSNNCNINANNLLRSDRFSDLTIICHGRHFNVHKVIMCAQSKVISELCDDMKVENTSTIEHKEFDEDTVERMTDFAYKKEYEVTKRPKRLPSGSARKSTLDHDPLATGDDMAIEGVQLASDVSATSVEAEEQEVLSATDKLIIHARVFWLAEYFDMSELRDYACGCFVQVTDNESAEIDFTDFTDVAREVCKKTYRDDCLVGCVYYSSLRTGLLSLIATYAPKLAVNSEFLSDIFCELGKRMADLEAANEVLQSARTTTNEGADMLVSAAERERQRAEERFHNAEGVMHRLIRSLTNLPATCANKNCNNEFGSLKSERNGNGDWQVRCGARKCRCKLN